MIDNPVIKTIVPKPNSAIIFGASSVHRVNVTKSPDEFAKGRFSANIWIGIK